MAETFNRSAEVQVGSGYRELPDGGASWAPDLKTIVYAGVGVFLGILAGTSIADGTWSSLGSGSKHQAAQVASVQSVTTQSVPTNADAAKSVQPPPLQARSLEQGTPKPAAAVQSTTAQSLAAQPPAGPRISAAQLPVAQPSIAARANTAQSAAVPLATVGQSTSAQSAAVQSTVASQASVPHKLYATQQASGIQRTYAAHRHRLVRRVGARRRHFARRRVHIRHRLRAALKTTADAGLPSDAIVPKPPNAVAPAIAIPSAFTIHGEVTVFNFDSSAGIIQTYEGETFALDKTQGAGGTRPWDDYVRNFHYQCDQFGSCTLNGGGGVTLNARRTR